MTSAGSVRYLPSGSASTTASAPATTCDTEPASAPIAAIALAIGAASPDRAMSTRYPASTARAASTLPSRPAPMMPSVRMGEVTATPPSYGQAQRRLRRGQWFRSMRMISALRLPEYPSIPSSLARFFSLSTVQSS